MLAVPHSSAKIFKRPHALVLGRPEKSLYSQETNDSIAFVDIRHFGNTA